MAAGGDREGDEDYTPLVPQVRVRVLVECNSVEQFVGEYHRFVDGDRIFIATDVTEAIGNLVQFRVDLGDGRAVLLGTGTVLQLRPPHDGMPRGMVLQFIALDDESARIVEAMSRRRARMTPADGVLSMEAPPAGSDEADPRVATPVPPAPEGLDSQSETRSFSRSSSLRASRSSARVDSTAPFRLVGGAPDARRTWRTRSVERQRVLPANPFCDVPDVALAYFVDWALERNGRSSPAGARSVAFHDVRMEAPRRRRRRPPTWVAFVLGLALGGAGIVSAYDAWHGSATPGRAQLPTATREVPTFPKPASEVRTFPPVVAHDSSPPGQAMPPSAPSPVARAREPAGKTVAPALGNGRLVPLSIAADPGAQVILDGQRVGRTPLVLKVPRGAHAVELQRPRYQTAHLEVEAPGRAVAHLDRPRATLHVTSNVADAEVFIDGDSVGRAPLTVAVAGYERCGIEVRAGARTWKKKLYVKPPRSDVTADFPTE
ncbi:MAG: hypothetical protein JWN44_7192 [Myxococcales bacterium]|nr:hypothetical protein [Myxococcales bacterium]